MRNQPEPNELAKLKKGSGLPLSMLCAVWLGACTGTPGEMGPDAVFDAGRAGVDGGSADGSFADAGVALQDGGEFDGGRVDAGVTPPDGGGAFDGGGALDGGRGDGGVTSPDGGGRSDAGATADGGAGPADAGVTVDAGGAVDSGRPPILDAGAYDSTDALYDAKYAALLGPIPAGAKFVSPTGDDSNPGTEGAPYRTLRKAVSNISGGGQVIVEDGTYTGPDNWLNSQSAVPPNGTAAAYTVVRARHPFAVRLTQTARPAGYWQSIINVPSTSAYLWFDGFVADQSWESSSSDDNAAFTVNNEGQHIRVSRMIVRRTSCSQYGGAYYYGDNSVFEDVHAFGSARYMFAGGSAGDARPSGHSVVRRAISYLAFGPGLEPTASFNFYGSNDYSYTGVKDMLWANAYEIDSPNIETSRNVKYGSWYAPKLVRNVRHVGCGSLNSGAEYGGFDGDAIEGTSSGVWGVFVDSFVSGLAHGSPPSVYGFGQGGDAPIVVDHCTVAAASNYATNSASVTNSEFAPAPQSLVVRRDGRGAEQLFAIGALLSEFGDPQAEVPQLDLPLWPFPYEMAVKRVFDETIVRDAKDSPQSVSATTNPFQGQSLQGLPMTFTRRVWEATGQATPDFSTVY